MRAGRLRHPHRVVERACAVTPGLESPTVSPLRDPAWSAIRAMVPRAGVHQVMDDLFALGGRGILVTDIHALSAVVRLVIVAVDGLRRRQTSRRSMTGPGCG